MPNDFIARHLAVQPDAIAPDGSEVRLLAATQRGSMAQFSLPAGRVSFAVCHRTVEELWYFTDGRGRLWRDRPDLALGRTRSPDRAQSLH